MRKYLYNIVLALSLCLFAMGCSNNDANSPSGNDGKGGSLAIFAIKGDYLYMVDNQKLNVFKITEPKKPIFAGAVNIGFNIETLFSYNEFLFIGSRNAMYIFSVENPENPKKVTEARHFNACDPVVANETHAFVTLHSNNECGNNRNVLIVYDITDLEKPVEKITKNLIHPMGLALYKNYLAVCDDELIIYDITNPEDPTIANTFPGRYKDLVIYNDILFTFGQNKISQYKWDGDDFKNLKLINTLDY